MLAIIPVPTVQSVSQACPLFAVFFGESLSS